MFTGMSGILSGIIFGVIGFLYGPDSVVFGPFFWALISGILAFFMTALTLGSSGDYDFRDLVRPGVIDFIIGAISYLLINSVYVWCMCSFDKIFENFFLFSPSNI